MIAVWSGKPAQGLGGTADIVKYSIENKKTVWHVDNIACKVIKL